MTCPTSQRYQPLSAERFVEHDERKENRAGLCSFCHIRPHVNVTVRVDEVNWGRICTPCLDEFKGLVNDAARD